MAGVRLIQLAVEKIFEVREGYKVKWSASVSYQDRDGKLVPDGQLPLRRGHGLMADEKVRSIGTPPDVDADYVARCPECKTLLDGSTEGYGFAMGGGIGSYQYCPSDQCGWFYKLIHGTEA